MVANVHKAQGLSLKNVWVDLRPSNKAAGMTYVALSRATKLADLVIEPMTFDRLRAVTKTSNLRKTDYAS
jgi:ATP-dependent exoDNAse (exonuclease V) alpha subunit